MSDIVKYETDNFVIYYKSGDKNINYLIESLNKKANSILEFFNLKTIRGKQIIKIYYSLEDYKKHLIPFLKVRNSEWKDWMRADTFDDNINMLEFNLYSRNFEDKETAISHYKMTILHEFVHICHHEYQGQNDSMGHIWFSEALATNLSGQSYFGEIRCTYDELINNFDNADSNYVTSYFLGKHLIEKYGKAFTLSLIGNKAKLDEFAPILFNEVF